MGFPPSVAIFRIEKDPAYWQLRNDEFFAYGQNEKTGTQERVKNGWKRHSKVGKRSLQQFLVNCHLASRSKSGLEGLHGSLFLLNEELHSNLF